MGETYDELKKAIAATGENPPDQLIVGAELVDRELIKRVLQAVRKLFEDSNDEWTAQFLLIGKLHEAVEHELKMLGFYPYDTDIGDVEQRTAAQIHEIVRCYVGASLSMRIPLWMAIDEIDTSCGGTD